MNGLTAGADREGDHGLLPAQVTLVSEPKPRRADWNIVTQTLGVGAITVMAKTAGTAKAVFLARFFGSSKELDAYLISFLIPSLRCDALSGALVPALVPSLVEAERLDGRNSANAIYSYSLRRALLLMVILAGAVASCLGVLSTLARPVGLSGRQLERQLFLMMTPMLPLSAVNGIWRSLLNARKRFFIAAIAAALTPLVIIGFLFCWSGSFGVYALALGTTGGMAAEMLVLGAAAHYLGYPLASPAMARPSAAPSIHAQYRALLASNFLVGGSAFINQAIAATLGSGGISTFNFGTRLITVLLAIGPVSLSTIILPSLSEVSAERDWGRLRGSVVRRRRNRGRCGRTGVLAVVTSDCHRSRDCHGARRITKSKSSTSAVLRLRHRRQRRPRLRLNARLRRRGHRVGDYTRMDLHACAAVLSAVPMGACLRS